MEGGGDYHTMTELVIDGSIMCGVRGLTANEGNGWIDTSVMTRMGLHEWNENELDDMGRLLSDMLACGDVMENNDLCADGVER